MAEALRDMRLFVAVYEERSFTAAAQREHATQSGVSHHIRNLEERRGTRLFNRGIGLAVTPTPAGDAYYRGCIATLRSYEDANRAIAAFRGAQQGELSVGLVPTVTRPLLAPTLARFVAAYPNVVIRTIEAPSVRLISEVRAGELDLAVAFALPGEVGVRSTPFACTRCFLVSRPVGRARQRAATSLADVQTLRLVAPPRPNAIRGAIEATLGAHGVHVDRWLDVDSMAATLDFVGRTDWLSIVPGLMLLPEKRASRLNMQSLQWPPIMLELSLIEPLRRSLTPPARAFIELLGAEIEGHSPDYVERIVLKPPRASRSKRRPG